jgi:hypothetical protein
MLTDHKDKNKTNRRTCRIDAGLSISHLLSSGTVLARSATAPATTGEATEVPDRTLHPPRMLDPRTACPNATMSGLTRPEPKGSSHVVIPREEKLATWSYETRYIMSSGVVESEGMF